MKCPQCLSSFVSCRIDSLKCYNCGYDSRQSSVGLPTEPWVKVDRKWWKVHRENDARARRVVDTARALLPFFLRWQQGRGVGPEIADLIEAVRAYEAVPMGTVETAERSQMGDSAAEEDR